MKPTSWLGLALAALALYVGAAEPTRKGKAVANGGKDTEESLGSQLLSAVVTDDLAKAAAIFGGVSASQAVRLSNAIDWRGKSVLMHAAQKNLAPMAQLLIQHKARLDAADYTNGATALMLAARNGSAAAVSTLIEAGAKLGATTPHGTTVLMQAVANGSAPVVGQLLAAGAEPGARDKAGASALSLAASTGNADVVRLLTAAGAPINEADSQPRPADCLQAHTFTHLPRVPDEASLRCVQGSTPILIAAAAGHVQ